MQVFHGKGASFIEFEQQVRLWMQMTEMEPPKRAAALVVHMNSTARQVCLAVAGDHIAKNNGAEHVVNTIYREVARFLQFRRTGQTTDENIAEFDF